MSLLCLKLVIESPYLRRTVERLSWACRMRPSTTEACCFASTATSCRGRGGEGERGRGGEGEREGGK